MTFPKYNLNAKQIKGLANIVQHEQGTKAGMYAEASLMANLTDISGDDKATVERIIAKATGGWFAYGKQRYNDGYSGKTSVCSTAIQAVTNVIVKGKRTLPRYVNEHDCMSDIKSVEHGTKSNKHAWVPHTTVINNRFGSRYVFFDFPGGSKTGVDPFGYTSKEYRKKYGEFCYTIAESEKQDMGAYTATLRDPLAVWVKGYIKMEDKGDSVKEVKKFITWLYGATLSSDNVYNKELETYVRYFQKYAGITEDGLWGHDSWTKATKMKIKDRYMCHLYYYNKYIKTHGKLFVYDSTADKPFSVVVSKINKKTKAKINCGVPCVWAFADMGFSPSTFYAKEGSFKDKFTGTMTKYLTRIKSGSAVGKTIKQAADAKLLKPGDILCFKGITHTFCYKSGYKVYDGGSYAKSKGYENVGITVDYSTGPYKDKKISEILRWK